MASELGVTYTDIRKKLNPGNDPSGFLGSASGVSSDDVTTSILEAEEILLARLPQRYVALLNKVDGEYLFGGADSPGGAKGDGTETTATLGLFPASNLKLYRNFSGNWSERQPVHRMTVTTDYTFVAETGVITLTAALVQGDTLIAEYDHTALSKCNALRGLLKNLVAAEWARRLYPDDEQFERYTEWETQAYSDLKRMRATGDDRVGILMFDRLDLVHETRGRRNVAADPDLSGANL